MSQKTLHADSFQQDPRIQQARELIRAALSEQQAAMPGVRAADRDRQETYESLIQTFSDVRGGKLYYPYLGSGIGHGPLVELDDGSIKYDMISGIGVHGFGHSDPGLVDAAVSAALSDPIMQGNLQQNRESALLCGEFVSLASATGAAMRHCFLTTSGAMANENALKILFQARQPAQRVLAFSNCFAGRTLATSQLTDRAKNRVGLPTTLAVDYVPFFDAAHPETSAEITCQRLREHLQRYPGLHAGMIFELIQGEGGYYSAPRDFFVTLCQQLRQAGIPIWFDEIQTFGRTSRPFAFQHFQLDEFADVVTVGKMTQVCATLFRDELVPQPGLISQTFTGATSAIFAARHLLRRLQDGNYFGPEGRIMQVSERFVRRLEEVHAALPQAISGPWGYGGMLAMTVFDGSPEKTRQTLDALFDAGVIAFSAGADPTRIRMLPPVGCIQDEQIDEVCHLIHDVLQAISEKA